MKNINIKYLLLSLVFLGNSVFAQKEVTWQKNLEIADKLSSEGAYYDAIDFYQKAFAKNQNASIATKLADNYMFARNYKAAEEAFEQAINLGSNAPYIYYNYALMLKMNGKYDLALENFNKFKGLGANQIYLDKADIEIDGCNMALQSTVSDCGNKVTHLERSVNSYYSEYGPILFADTALVFASIHADSAVVLSDQDRKDEVVQFYSSKIQNKKYLQAEKLDLPINIPSINSVNGAFSLDKKRFYFTQCKEDFNRKVTCEIYVISIEKNGTWTDPEKLGGDVNVAGYSSTQPSVKATDKKNVEQIFFSSNKPGSLNGSYDIWMTTRDPDGNFEKASNIGNVINTFGDEVTPFYDNDMKEIYFSSNGHPSYGGMDIFRSSEKSIGFSDPENIQAPLNSSVDDIYFTKKSGTSDGYLVSNRPPTNSIFGQTCCDDIFSFESNRVFVNGFVLMNGEPIADADVKLYLMDSKKETEINKTISSKTEKYRFELIPNKVYKLVAKKQDLQKGEEIFTVDCTTSQLDAEGNMRKDVTLNSNDLYVTGKVFDAKDSKDLCGSKVSLYSIDKATGTDVYESMQEFDCNKTMFFKLKPGKKYKFKTQKEGYLTGFQDIPSENAKTPDTLLVNISMDKLSKDKVYRINNILYDFDKSTLRDQSMQALDSVFLILQENPNIVVELSSHTDSKGSDVYNEKLSQSRAESCVNYLIRKGIPRNRIQPKGYGEAKPVAPNQNADGSDNPDNRQLNRRTEIRVIGELVDGKVIYEK